MPKIWTQEADLLVEELLAKHAAEVDRTGSIPPTHLDELARRGFYGFLLSDGMTPDLLIDTIATVLSGCLATGFVLAQHLGALRAIAFSTNASVRDRYLAPMTAGDFRCGVSYAGARSTPTLFAQRTETGVVLNGVAPFVTGWDHINGVVTSALIRDGEDESVATMMVPIHDIGGVTHQRISLIAADASATVRVTFEDALVDGADIIGVTPASGFKSARGSLTDWINGALPLGVLAKCVRELENQDVDATAYRTQYSSLRARFASAMDDAQATYALRADLADAAVATAAANVVAVGSRATAAHSTAERLMREATFALVCTTRDAIRTELLTRLAPDVA